MRTKLTTIAATGLLLAGCGGAQLGEDTTPTIDDNPLKPNTQKLILADKNATKRHIANGLRLQLSGDDDIHLEERDGIIAAPIAGGYSHTNMHVDGVDEADVAKYDGDYWFIANQPRHSRDNLEMARPSIKVVATDPAAPNAEIVGQFQLDEEWGGAGEMYLVSDGETTTHVASIRHRWDDVMPYLPGVPVNLQADAGPSAQAAGDEAVSSLAYFATPQNSEVRVQLLDVNTPAMPMEDWEVRIDGSLIESRKVNNTLYLVTRFDPWLTDLEYEHGDISVREKNEEIIDEAEFSELMPHYYIGDTKTPLSDACFLRTNASEYYGYSHLVNITAIDLASQRVIGSTCLSSGVEALSLSAKNLYLTETVENPQTEGEQTVVHKFTLMPEGAQYAASGSVEGSLGWSSDRASRMHEDDDQFRIVTSQWQSGSPVHHLSILVDDKSGSLTQAAVLPNEAYPTPIGKPGDDISSVQFRDDTAYVTFQRTDSLYAIDLSEPLNPRISGELEIPGFARYTTVPFIYALPHDHFFTVGYWKTNGRVSIQIYLIKVTDGVAEVGSPLTMSVTEDDHRIYSEALHDLRALNVVTLSEDQVRFALPFTTYDHSLQVWRVSGLRLMQIDYLAGRGSWQMTSQSQVMATPPVHCQGFSTGQGTVRSILQGDAVFFTFNSAVQVAQWEKPKDAVGPIPAEPLACADPEPIVCTDEVVYGLHVTVVVDSVEVNPCNARVSARSGDAIEELVPGILAPGGRGCTFYGAGEAPGFYEITASLPGIPETGVKVQVDRNECHVIPRKLQLYLQDNPRMCPEVPQLSIRLSLSFEDATDMNPNICGADVMAINNGETYRMEPSPPPADRPSDARPYCSFEGPYDVAGEFTLQASLAGYEPLEISGISVEENGCHVELETVFGKLKAQ